jgi:hypothetical protein
VWIDHGSMPVERGSIVVEGHGRVDRSMIDPGRAGSIVVEGLGCVDRSMHRADRSVHGSVSVERDRSWIDPPRPGSIGADRLGRVDRSDRCMIDHGSVPVERDRSLYHADRSWIDPRSTGIDHFLSD